MISLLSLRNKNRCSASSFSCELVLILFLLLTAAPLHADDTMSQSAKSTQLHFLKTGKPDAATLLPPPPLVGSVEQAADMDEVKTVYHAASSNDMAAAYSEKKFSVFNFTGAVGPFFIETNLPKTTAFFEKVQKDAETVTDLGKVYFKRPRPYVTDPSLANGKLEKSFSYPSGHSTESMTLALVLAEMLPDKHDAILAHARTMGWHRVQITRHYPTDIYAGRVLAQAIVKQFKKSDSFAKEFAKAKAEIEAAQAAAKN
jgi:acid phosphatase (class A)